MFPRVPSQSPASQGQLTSLTPNPNPEKNNTDGTDTTGTDLVTLMGKFVDILSAPSSRQQTSSLTYNDRASKKRRIDVGNDEYLDIFPNRIVHSPNAPQESKQYALLEESTGRIYLSQSSTFPYLQLVNDNTITLTFNSTGPPVTYLRKK